MSQPTTASSMPLEGGTGHIDMQTSINTSANSQPSGTDTLHADTQSYSRPLYPQCLTSDPPPKDWAFIRTIDVQTLVDSPIRLMPSIDKDTVRPCRQTSLIFTNRQHPHTSEIQPSSGGPLPIPSCYGNGAQGRSDTVSTRFTLWEDGDTGRLINLWNKENQRQVRKQINRKKSTRPPPRAAAMIQLERGQLSRARRLLQSNGLADITDDAIAPLHAAFKFADS